VLDHGQDVGLGTLFTGVGMEAFAERARAELRATGARAW
jgi:hypothetical protein